METGGAWPATEDLQRYLEEGERVYGSVGWVRGIRDQGMLGVYELGGRRDGERQAASAGPSGGAEVGSVDGCGVACAVWVEGDEGRRATCCPAAYGHVLGSTRRSARGGVPPQ